MLDKWFFITYAAVKICSGKASELNPSVYVISGMALITYLVI